MTAERRAKARGLKVFVAGPKKGFQVLVSRRMPVRMIEVLSPSGHEALLVTSIRITNTGTQAAKFDIAINREVFATWTVNPNSYWVWYGNLVLRPARRRAALIVESSYSLFAKANRRKVWIQVEGLITELVR
jgi:hypothetical protein